MVRCVRAAARGLSYAVGEVSRKYALARGVRNSASILCHRRSPGTSHTTCGGSTIGCSAVPFSCVSRALFLMAGHVREKEMLADFIIQQV